MKAPEEFIDTLKIMLFQMETERLEVSLIPHPDIEKAQAGAKIRYVENQNPEWYRLLCALYQSTAPRYKRCTKFHTKIKRQHIMSILERLIKGMNVNSKYAEELIVIAEGLEEDWEDEYRRYNEL